MSHSSQELFTRWVETPIAVLRKIPRGDGALAALAISLGLYERFIKSVLHKAGTPGTPENFDKEVSADLGISADIARRFWNGYRLGLMHAFQPKNYVQNEGRGDAWGWDMAEGEGYEAFPTVEKKADKLFILRLDPWKFTEHVLERWRKNPVLMDEIKEFAFGKIQPVEQKREAPPAEEHPYLAHPESFRTYSEPQIYITATGQWPGSTDGRS